MADRTKHNQQIRDRIYEGAYELFALLGCQDKNTANKDIRRLTLNLAVRAQRLQDADDERSVAEPDAQTFPVRRTVDQEIKAASLLEKFSSPVIN